jgi:3-oxoacid CoA-transferase subunit A
LYRRGAAAARNSPAAAIKYYKSNTYKRAALPLALFHAAMRTSENSWEQTPVAESKVYPDAASALKGLTFDGMTVMSGGFGLSGNAENLITALKEDGVKNITMIANNCGADGVGLWVLLNNGQIKKMISSYVGENKLFEQLYLDGKLELELNPQGTLAERIRAGGAGIPAFYTRTGVGTVVAEGKPTDVFDGLTYIRETWLRADLSIVKAWKGDTEGNLVYRKTARNFNPVMATAGKVTIAEVEQLVQPGELDPDQIHTPGIFVQRILQGKDYKKPIERVTTRPRPTAGDV